MRYLKLEISVLLLAAMAAAGQAQIFDNSGPAPTFDNRVAGSSSVTTISVGAENVFVTGFSVLNQMQATGDVKFVIFDANTDTLLFSQVKSYGIDGANGSWKTTDSMPAFELMANSFYLMGSIQDVDSAMLYRDDSFTQNGITSLTNGTNISNFGSPQVVGTGFTDPFLMIDGRIQAVPEPAPFAAMAVGGLTLLRRRKRN